MPKGNVFAAKRTRGLFENRGAELAEEDILVFSIVDPDIHEPVFLVGKSEFVSLTRMILQENVDSDSFKLIQTDVPMRDHASKAALEAWEQRLAGYMDKYAAHLDNEYARRDLNVSDLVLQSKKHDWQAPDIMCALSAMGHSDSIIVDALNTRQFRDSEILQACQWNDWDEERIFMAIDEIWDMNSMVETFLNFGWSPSKVVECLLRHGYDRGPVAESLFEVYEQQTDGDHEENSSALLLATLESCGWTDIEIVEALADIYEEESVIDFFLEADWDDLRIFDALTSAEWVRSVPDPQQVIAMLSERGWSELRCQAAFKTWRIDHDSEADFPEDEPMGEDIDDTQHQKGEGFGFRY